MQILSSTFNVLSSIINQHNTILLGDFNFPDINWNNLSSSSPPGNLFCEFVFDHSLHQFVDLPTHTKGNILDLVLCKSHTLINNISVCSNELLSGLISDHNLISISIPGNHINNRRKSSSHRFIYSKGNFNALNHFIECSDFTDFYDSNDIEFQWLFLKSTINKGCDLFIPKSKPNKPGTLAPKWMNSDTTYRLHKIRSLRKKVRSHPSVNNVMSLKAAEKQTSAVITSTKLAYESKLVNEFAQKENNRIYKYIRSFTKQSSLPSSLHYESKRESESYGIATIFNEFFQSVFTNPYPTSSSSTIHNLQTRHHSYATGFNEFEITIDDVSKSLYNLNASKAMGIDNIHNIVLKHCSSSLSRPIHHLFSQCLLQSYLPIEWRTHKIVPIFKSGDRSSVKNYRPISLLCCISKVLEHIIFDKVYDYISPLISVNQFGFMKNRSTVQQLLKFSNSIFDAISRRNHMDVVYFDIRKAFDSVPHDQLLTKLQNLGISGSALAFFRAYLFNRQQCVVIDNTLSDLVPVASGVPQGSILGPLLFITYINDLPSSIYSSIMLTYADDTKCGKEISSSDDSLSLQSDINIIANWSLTSRLLLHDTKTCFIRFCLNHANSDFDYHLNNNPIQMRAYYKDLGVIFSSDLSWSKHIESIISKAYRILFLIKRTFSISSPTSVKKQLYQSLVLPILTYCSTVWRPFLLKDITILEKVQKRATKYIVNDSSLNYKDRLSKLQMLPLMFYLEIADIIFTVSSIKHPSDHFDIKQFISFSTSNTRSSALYKLKHRLTNNNISRHSFFNRIPRLWNSLPPIDPSISVRTIKRLIIIHLTSHFTTHFDPHNTCTFHYLCPCNSCSLIPGHRP